MIGELADALLARVYYPATAVVSMDKDGCVIGIRLFDSQFGTREQMIAERAESVAVLCGHPDGSMKLTAEELRNCRRIARQSAGVRLNVYICGEDIGCIEVDISDDGGYNEENAI